MSTQCSTTPWRSTSALLMLLALFFAAACSKPFQPHPATLPKMLSAEQRPLVSIEPPIHLNTKLQMPQKIHLDSSMRIFGPQFLPSLEELLIAKGWAIESNPQNSNWITEARFKHPSANPWLIELQIWEKTAQSKTTQPKQRRGSKSAPSSPTNLVVITDKSEWRLYTTQITLQGKTKYFEAALRQIITDLF